MLNESCSASHATIRTGYKIASQFTRDYTVVFGLSPMRHVAGLADPLVGSNVERNDHV